MFFAQKAFALGRGATEFAIGTMPYWAVELGYCSALTATDIMARADALDVSFATIAVAENHLTADDAILLYSLIQDCDEVDLDEEPADPRLLRLLPAEDAQRYRLIPWRRDGEMITYVTDQPHLFGQLTSQKSYWRQHAKIVLAHPDAWQSALAKCYGSHLIVDAERSVIDVMSCRTLFTNPKRMQRQATLAVTVLLGCAIWNFGLTLSLLIGVALFSMLLMQSLKLLALYARPPTSHHNDIILSAADKNVQNLPVISIMVPLFKEKEIASSLLTRLDKLDYPRALLDIILVLEAEDTQTAAVIAQTDLPGHMRAIAVPPGSVTTKPRAMNYCLPFCKGQYIGIYDAEDAPEPQMLYKIARHFRSAAPDVACIQGELTFYNSRANFLARCFTIEYGCWFRLMLPAFDKLRLVMPLGGTTLFFKADILRNLGSWDAFNVTEDADLGIRLARAGYRTEFVNTTTFEEANNRAIPWVKQRSRWLKGYIITYLVHMRAPRALLRDVGLWRFIGVNVLFGMTILQITLAPAVWSLWVLGFGGDHPMQEIIGDRGLTAVFALLICATVIEMLVSAIVIWRARKFHLLATIPLTFFYHPLASFAIAKAIAELIHKPFYWDKTEHGHSTEDRPDRRALKLA